MNTIPVGTGLFRVPGGWWHIAWAGHDVTWSCVYFAVALMWLAIAAATFCLETRR